MPMKYVYAALLLHSWAQPVTEDGVKKIVSAAGGQAEETQVKALVAALSEVNIDEALKSASSMMMAPAAAPAAATPGKPGEKKEEKPAEDEKKKEEEALAGLGALFG
jgi:large subunit ribosomal protein L12